LSSPPVRQPMPGFLRLSYQSLTSKSKKLKMSGRPDLDEALGRNFNVSLQFGS